MNAVVIGLEMINLPSENRSESLFSSLLYSLFNQISANANKTKKANSLDKFFHDDFK